MDISSTASVTTAAETNVSTQTQKTSDTSFKEEMGKAEKNSNETNAKETSAKNTAENAEKAEKTDEKSKNTEQNDNTKLDNGTLTDNFDINQAIILSGEVSVLKNNALSGETILANNIQSLMDASKQLSTVMTDTQIPTKVDYSNIQMDTDDAKFFADLVQNTDKTLQDVTVQLRTNVEENVKNVEKNVKVSTTLLNALSESLKTNQPFRINFDKDISVIIKVDRDGTLSATFIPGDKAVEQYLRQNISTLRQRFDDRELSYKELSYTGQQQRNRRNNKENER